MDRQLAVAAFEVGMTPARPYLQRVGATLIVAEYPDLVFEVPHPRSGKACRFRVRYDDFDAQPASIQVVGSDNQPLPFAQWPQGGIWNPENNGTLCVPGVREYHAHSSHRSEPWEQHRAAGTHTFGRYIEIAISSLGLGTY